MLHSHNYNVLVQRKGISVKNEMTLNPILGPTIGDCSVSAKNAFRVRYPGRLAKRPTTLQERNSYIYGRKS